MRKIILLLTIQVLVVIYNLSAQPVLYGVTPGGGQSIGTIYRLETGNNNLETAYAFPDNPRYPNQFSTPIQASDGKLYGMTTFGGTSGGGTIFSFDPATNTFTKLHDFTSANGGYPNGSQNGSSPNGSLVQASNGKLYGVTSYGGVGGTSNSVGAATIFSFEPASKTFTKLHDFTDNDGGYAPNGTLVQASNGRLYGLTNQGGSNYTGTIFSFDPATNSFSKVHDFAGTNGSFPNGSLVQASNGKLYGMTGANSNSPSGINNFGTIFSFDPATNTHSKLYDFTNANGRSPIGSLVQASNGQLYGMTPRGGSNGYGTIFSFDPVANTHSKLLDFSNSIGRNPLGSLMEADNGNLYGMTTSGGSNDQGTIFSFDPSTNTHSKLHDFSIINGGFPYGSLVQAHNGKFYGVTSEGGIIGDGTIFSFDPVTNIHLKLYDFTNANGKFPYGSLVQSRNGNLYGMTQLGGSNGYGTIFLFDPATNTFTKLHDFNNTNGSYANGSLVQASNGRLYGMTSRGGSNDDNGTIFLFDPATNTFTKLHDFTGANGGYPNGSLVEATNGKLYGLTVGGGSEGGGTIFSFDPVTNTHSKLHDFIYAGGNNPYGSLVQASNGKLYGMTQLGGSEGYGTIFSFDPAINLYSKLLDFNKTNGANPFGSLVQANNGKLYGMTYAGGSNFSGIIFSFDPATNIHNKVHDFNYMNGDRPFGTLLQASDGKLYGFNYSGGTGGLGTIFSFDPATNSHNKLQDFNENKDGGVHDGALIELKACNPTTEIVTVAASGPLTFCSGKSVLLRANTGTGYTFQWKKAGVNIPNAIQSNFTATEAGAYSVVVTNATGCSATSAGVNVIINPVPLATVAAASSLTFCEGKSVQIRAILGAGYTYQWKWGGANIAGATSSNYTASATGYYTVIVTNAAGCSATSAALAVTVKPLPLATITATGPTTICSGKNVLLKANTGTNYTYQWLRGATAIPGATQVNYSAAQVGYYSVIVTNSSGCSVTSAAVAVTVTPLPAALITPAGSLTFCTGQTVSLKANTGTNYTYQWKKTGVNIPDATLVSYTASASGVYSVVVTNAAGCSVVSPGVTVTVNSVPLATVVAASATTFCAGKNVLLKAINATGYKYQWRKNGVNIPHDTTSNYTATATGVYSVVVTNVAGCSTTSIGIAVTVTMAPLATVAVAGPTNFCEGKNALLKAIAAPGYTYQWKKNGVNIAAQTQSNYTATATGVYTVMVTNAEGCSTLSTHINVTVAPAPAAIITANGPLTFPQGGNVILNVPAANGNVYQWKKDGINITGATSESYAATAGGSYTVVVTNASGCQNVSQPTVVSVTQTRPITKNVIGGEDNIAVYPNPMYRNDYLNIDRNITGTDKSMLVTIYDMAGRKINSQLLTAGDRTIKIKGASGMYMVECRWGVNKRKVFSVIKIE